MKSPRAVFFADLFLVAAGAALAEDVPRCRGLDYDACQANWACGWYTVMKQGMMTLEDGTTKTMQFCIRLVLEWQEIGGPPVIAPGNPSYGTSTIRDVIPYEFGGTVDLVFAPEGVRCRIQLPADWLSDVADPGSGIIARATAK